jgi:hypothetical protein
MRCYAITEVDINGRMEQTSRAGIYEASRLLGVPTAALPVLVCFARPSYVNEVRYLQLGRFGYLDDGSQMLLWRELADMFTRCTDARAPGRRRWWRRDRAPGEDPQLATIEREWDALIDPDPGRASVLDGIVSVSDKLASTVASGATIAEALGAATGG